MYEVIFYKDISLFSIHILFMRKLFGRSSYSLFAFLINTYNQVRIRIEENVCLSSEFVELLEQDARAAGSA